MGPLPPARRTVRVAALALVLTGALSACGPEQTLTARQASATYATAATAASTTGSTATGDTGSTNTDQDGGQTTADPSGTATTTASSTAGSVTVSLTSPIARSGTATALVTCATGRIYRARAGGVGINGVQVSFAVVVTGYQGPGTYRAVVDVTVRQPSGVVTTVAAVAGTPVTLSAEGGSFDLSATGSAGRTVAGSLSWVCGS